VVAGGTGPVYFYTAANGTVWTKTATGTATQVGTGKVIGAVSGMYNGSRIALFGEGTNHSLWYTIGIGSSWSGWVSLGGTVTAQPGAVYRGSADAYSVFARGSNGAVWPVTTARPGGAPGTPRAATCWPAPGRPRPTSAASPTSWPPAPTSSSTWPKPA
jgi:hypothetical protein